MARNISKKFRVFRQLAYVLKYALSAAMGVAFLIFVFFLAIGNIFFETPNHEEINVLIIWIGVFFGFFFGWAIGWQRLRDKRIEEWERVYRIR
jgi:uncharacterized membrane protein YhaH (DUF805 family)